MTIELKDIQKNIIIKKTKKYMFYCKSGERSGKTVQYLLDNGVKNVNYLKDGVYVEFSAVLK